MSGKPARQNQDYISSDEEDEDYTVDLSSIVFEEKEDKESSSSSSSNSNTHTNQNIVFHIPITANINNNNITNMYVIEDSELDDLPNLTYYQLPTARYNPALNIDELNGIFPTPRVFEGDHKDNNSS
ncbi:MAG: hypothetical protein AABY27_04680 [Pseudomonadota bacterium]